MQVEKLEREFRYNGVKLADPSGQFSVQQVRDFYANTYPEIVNADIEGPEAVGNKSVFTFRRAVGTKGCVSLPIKIRRLADLVDAGAIPAREHGFVTRLMRATNCGQMIRLQDIDVRRVHRLYDECAGGAA